MHSRAAKSSADLRGEGRLLTQAGTEGSRRHQGKQQAHGRSVSGRRSGVINAAGRGGGAFSEPRLVCVKRRRRAQAPGLLQAERGAVSGTALGRQGSSERQGHQARRPLGQLRPEGLSPRPTSGSLEERGCRKH